MTAEWLNNDDGLVTLAIVGETDEISYREGGGLLATSHFAR